ncbi:MAG: Trm112 family protein [Bacteroidota bacterium]
MLKKELLDILCCPRCKGELNYEPEKNKLTCISCGTVYDINDGIPMLFPTNDGK